MHELRRIFGDILCGNNLSLKGLQTYFHVTVEKYLTSTFTKVVLYQVKGTNSAGLKIF